MLAVARLAPRRQLELAIRAVARVRAQHVDAHLRIVGPEVELSGGERNGYTERLLQLAASEGVAEHITFVGPRFGGALIDEYLAADMFVSTSQYENFGQPLAEAAASGLPLIATPTGVALDLLADGRAGILVPFQDPDALAAAVLRICADHPLRSQMAGHARAKAVRMFDWGVLVDRYVELYARLSSKGTMADG